MVHDLSTPAKLAEAISLRQRLIKGPRADARKVSKAVKSKLNQVGEDVTAHEAEIVSEFNRVELFISPQITRREEEIEEEAKREALRKAAHRADIARIAECVIGAEEKSAERLADGIVQVGALEIVGFEEFQQEAEETKLRTLAALTALYDKAVAREAAKAEADRVAAESAARALTITQLGTITDSVTACLGKSGMAIALHIELLKATQYPAGVEAAVLSAHDKALTQMAQLHAAAVKQEENDVELAKLRAQQAPAAPPAAEPVPVAPVAIEAAAPPAAATVQESTRFFGYSRPLGASRPVAPAPAPVAPATEPATPANENASIETSEAEAIELPPGTAVFVVPEEEAPAHAVEPSVLLDTLSLIDHLDEALKSRFPTAPKLGAQWWLDLAEIVEELRPQLEAAIANIGSPE